MGIKALEKNRAQKVHSSRLGKLLNSIIRFFDWIAKGQNAGALCKG